MFDEKVSIFQSFQADPKSIPLAQWLKVCKEGSRYAKQVEQYRSTGRDDLKKSLPLITVGAICEGGRKLENVTTRTGWISLDVDGKDNPHIKDAKALRDEIAKIVYVAFSALSTGGKGVWALVKVKHPERQAEHFEQLIKDFASRGIILDSSKGKNPNDARFYSYDPGAIVKDSFKIYDRLPIDNKCSPFISHSKVNVNTPDGTLNYGKKALEDEISILSNAPEGDRNNQLFKSAAALGSLVAGGVLEEHTVKDLLFDAARSTGLKESEINKTLTSGFNTGLQSPRTPEPNGHNRSMVSPSPKDDKRSTAKYESRNPAPHGYNPFTGEIFDERGYPEDWDEIDTDLEVLMQRDPIVNDIVEIFGAELESQIQLN
ncbi:BT4734/BF3469 family protein [Gracilimonas tropica]|uniref:BT4734/BF3469 family protein n=1 Tax=Gracilimonas tropica TaxID=454600 RepID=UPI0003679CFE|nr:BT4734/BF3469 family protein [Gracilimonas tropica]